jgi:hypothetical protein
LSTTNLTKAAITNKTETKPADVKLQPEKAIHRKMDKKSSLSNSEGAMATKTDVI